MKGLIFKDLYQIKKTCMLLLCFAVGVLVISAFSNNTFFGMYAVILVSILPHTLMAYDERDKWDKYAATLPVSRKDIVSAKYIITSLFVSACLIISFFIFLFKSHSVEKSIINCSVLVIFGTLFPSFNLPLTYKFGVQKAKIVTMCFAGLIGALGAFLSNFERIVGDDLLYSISLLSAVMIMIAALVVYCLSYLISVKVYQKKEL